MRIKFWEQDNTVYRHDFSHTTIFHTVRETSSKLPHFTCDFFWGIIRLVSTAWPNFSLNWAVEAGLWDSKLHQARNLLQINFYGANISSPPLFLAMLLYSIKSYHIGGQFSSMNGGDPSKDNWSRGNSMFNPFPRRTPFSLPLRRSCFAFWVTLSPLNAQ